MKRNRTMKPQAICPLAFALALGAGFAPVQAANFTYHGDLIDGDAPAAGAYDLRVRAFGQPGASKALAEATELPGVKLVDGRFSVELDLPEDADGTTWVEVAVRKAGSGAAFETLGDPQPLSKVNGTCPGAWALDGNSGMPAGSFLGIGDFSSNQALQLKVKGRNALRIEPTSAAAIVNIIAGHESNGVSPGAIGATISGGGSEGVAPQPNFAYESYATIAGGFNNQAGNPFQAGGGELNAATVSGGSSNSAYGNYSTIPGGYLNAVGADFGYAAGRRAIVQASHTGTFVWADSQDVNFVSSGPNQYLARASGGVAFNGTPANPGFELSVFGNDPDAGFVEVLLTPKPSLNGNTGESIEFGAGPGGAGSNDANFRITQRNSSGGFFQALTIGSDGVTNVKNGAVGNVSDARLKKNIGGIRQPLDTLLALRGHMFEYIDPAKSMNAPGPRIGFIAQEVQQTLPNWVTPNDNGYLQVSTIGFEALAVEAIRDLKAEYDLRVENLESENAALSNRVLALERAMRTRFSEDKK